MKKILISGYYGFDNFGDEMILKILLEYLAGQDVTVLSATPKKTAKLYNVKTLYSFNMQNIMTHLPEFDVLISGGGSLLQNVTSNRSLMYYGGLIQMMSAMGRDVFIFAQGIGPIKGFWSNFFIKFILRQCKCISVRDEKSLNLLKKWKINANLVCDPVFSLNIPSHTSSKKVGIQIRKFDNLTDELIDNLVSQVVRRFNDRPIELISFQDKEDVGISTVVYNKFKKKSPTLNIKIVKDLTNNQIIQRISEYEYLIAMRYHACILGLKYGIKTMAICYDPKVTTLAQEANIPFLRMESNRNDYNSLFDELEDLKSLNLLKYSVSKEFDWTQTGLNELLSK